MVAAAGLPLDGDAPVLGIVSNDHARLYPVDWIYGHHIVNDVVGGRPVVVTFCSRCSSGICFDPVVAGRTLTFDVYGAYQGSVAMIDLQTRSVWAQVTGEAIAGPLAGTRLSILPLQMTTFARWLEQHLSSTSPLVDAAAGAGRAPLGEELPARWWRTVGRRDHRIGDRKVVVAVEVGEEQVAYVVTPRPDAPIAHDDDLAGIPVALLGGPGSWPLAYDRRTETGVVSFRVEESRIKGDLGSTWTPEGLAIDGPRRGLQLRFLPSRVVEWYAWAAVNPRTATRHLPERS